MSQFAFLSADFPLFATTAQKAEERARHDPNACGMYARQLLEEAVEWLYTYEKNLTTRPYDTTLSAKINHPPFKALVGQALFLKCKFIKDSGNSAVHQAKFSSTQALTLLSEVFHLCYWLQRHYGKVAPSPQLSFEPQKVQVFAALPKQSLAMYQEAAKRYGEEVNNRKVLDEKILALREELAAIKAKNALTPDTHDYKEAETRIAFIDTLLREAGWDVEAANVREYRITGLRTPKGIGFADYVLWGDNGKPLAVIEAKRANREAAAGREQARLYADALGESFQQRPVIFYSNGYEHFMWDDVNAPPRAIQGFLTRDELERLVQRRSSRLILDEKDINESIVNRYYQKRAITKIATHFEKDNQRKALLVMATGSGKTRTTIALAQLLMQKNWAFRVLFLADRKSLVKQATNAFKKFYPASSPVNLLDSAETNGRVYLSTYQTMMGLINDKSFGVGYFDLIVVDEAHRSVYNKYRHIFEYFDGLLVGLTATPKDEIDKNTYSLFNVQNGVPTDAYTLEEGVRDGHLVPPKCIDVPLKFVREGIKYAQLSESEKEEWDLLDWQEEKPEEIDAGAINKWLFNIDTVDKVLEHLMREGIKVADGERLGKTIIFAKNHAHAEFIAERFNANYPQYKGQFAKVIDNYIENSQQLIEDFEMRHKSPHIAISVDMLDTGIDVIDIVNLVFFKIVRSKTKFHQMIGRGTRLCPHIFGIGQDKTHFNVFDFCGNFDYFNTMPQMAEPPTQEPLSKRLFTARVDLLELLNGKDAYASEIMALLQGEIASLSLDNFIIRPKRLFVERYQEGAIWQSLNGNHFHEMRVELADLPFLSQGEEIEAKQFDCLVHLTQLALLKKEARFDSLKRKIYMIASSLEELQTVPLVRKILPFIQEILSEGFWQDITLQNLETVRLKLRGLVHLIERSKQEIMITNFQDALGEANEISLQGVNIGLDLEAFRKKALHFLKPFENHISLLKLRRNEALTQLDLNELERILRESGTEPTTLIKLKTDIGLGVFVRSLVGLERNAAKKAFEIFMKDKNFNGNQIDFINLAINHLTAKGVIEPKLLYESPYTDSNALGIEGIFNSAEIIAFIQVLEDVKLRAAA